MNRLAAIRDLLLDNIASDFSGFGPYPVPATAFPSPSTKPYITCRLVGSRHMDTLEGRNGLAFSEVQLDCWHPEYDDAEVLRAAITDLMTPAGALGYRGPAGSLTIKDTSGARTRDFYDGERELHQLIVCFDVVWEDA